MSFQNKSFWMSRDAECLTDGDINYGTSSRGEPKRAHQWFMGASGPELFCNKKQAVEVVGSRPMSGTSNPNVSLWENNPSLQSGSGQFTERLFRSETARTFNPVDRSISPIGTGNLNLDINGFEDQFGSHSSAVLSMSHVIEDPSSCFNYGGIRKVKVNQVRDSENGVSMSIGPSYSRGDNATVSLRAAYNETDNNITVAPTYHGNERTLSVGPTSNKAVDNFILMGHTFDRDASFVLMGHDYYKRDANIISVGHPCDKRNGGFISMGYQQEKGNGHILSEGPFYNKEQENFIPMGSAYDKANENFISIGASYDKGDNNIVSLGQKSGTSFVSMGTTYDEGNSSRLSTGQNHNKGKSSSISFEGFHGEPETNPSSVIISGYDMLTNQPTAQTPEALGQGDPIQQTASPVASVPPAAISKTKATPKNKEQKEPNNVPPNNFPSNVKSLLSTGMLDGVPVKYVSWSREKNLKGIIKGTTYLCGCDECKFSKGLNAYEFERHAGCKTKHPNNHIYFENGKTIYAVAQELKSTHQETLFAAIQTVTGSPINQKNFHIWKASFQAATRELQRIYGKDEVIMPA